jgi:putative protease
MDKKYELLSPVGNFQMLYSAIEAGADSVYFGIKGFNMREGAKNFKLSDLSKINKICKEKNVKMYLTLNTVMYDKEIKNVEKIIKKAKNYVDAIICWDISIIELCRKYKIPFHISTQASVSNKEASEFYKKLGAKNIVLARELNLKQIKEISKIVRVECFCHGAMCVAVSGRCFASQFIHGCSANRGKCAHPCRRTWTVTDDAGNQLKLDNNKVMSAKDLCTLPFIEKMKEAGITSFKIEGRNRPPEYVYTVTKIYRKALDKKLTKEELVDSINELKKVYNRGFSDGFYFKMPTADDFSYSENGEQTETKKYVGKVFSYLPKVGVALIKMYAGEIKEGDEIYLYNDNSAIKRIKIESIEKNSKKISIAKKGDEIGIKMPKCKKGSDIYLILKN